MSEAIQSKEIEVVARKDGETRKAILFKCQCGSEKWVVFAIHGKAGDHLHLQCAVCGESYCRGGQECDA